MGFFDRLFNRNTQYIDNTINGSRFYPLLSPNLFGKLQYLIEFNEIPELNAVINKRAKQFARGTYSVVNDNGDVQHDHWLQKLIQKPNWFQAQNEFLRQTKLWHDIFGDEYIYNLSPFGLSNPSRTSALFTLPPQLVDIKYKTKQTFFLTSEAPEIDYCIKANGGDTLIDINNLIHQNDNNVNVKEVNDKTVLQGSSKMDGLKPALVNIRMAYESRGVVLKYRGALGILSNQSQDAAGTIAIDTEEKKTIENAYKGYGGLSHQQQLIVTSANLKWQQMNVNPDKLGLYDETEEDFNKILDAYDTPSELFVRSKGATYENQKEARKGFIQDTIWPEAMEWCGALNAKYLQDEKVKLIVDYSHLSMFQEDIKNRADAMDSMVTALSKMLADGAITIDDYKFELAKAFKIGNKIK